ncbi:MAG: hypothetical protein Q9217_001556 [Psora testacea]
MDAASNAAKSVSDTIKGATDTASKETNKNIAKDSDASIGTRAEAGKDAVGDKAKEVQHKVSSYCDHSLKSTAPNISDADRCVLES